MQKSLFPEVASSFFIPLFADTLLLSVFRQESNFLLNESILFVLLDASDPKELTKK